ncbi:hypothetical protein Y88_2004 [Novosphingobium nitrogenifigens DSM 19370]|uniref:DUF4337 domain-containing protein n=1 Tax=Novosphingobium nitrogenifigens DSM 19370 TaxID=983920 RepID=F1Z5M0_9SPHN|nr:DUF4337 domain-containing protein [Novosphingobium nitrogenifigens]EGD60130.1 hypothetical protein Y88_2004 [Novosphingobium nitrogenifigens DSM 19370]
MEVEVSAEAKDKSLNRRIAITVVILSVFTGLCNIKDGNIVQGMEQAQAQSLDTWNEYQATKTKQHLAETARSQLAALAVPGKADKEIAALDAEIAKYKSETPALAAGAKAHADDYDHLNFHDDQFDAADAAISTAISLAAMAALVENVGLLFAAWAFGAFGIFMGLNGFLGGSFHPDVLSSILG